MYVCTYIYLKETYTTLVCIRLEGKKPSMHNLFHIHLKNELLGVGAKSGVGHPKIKKKKKRKLGWKEKNCHGVRASHTFTRFFAWGVG